MFWPIFISAVSFWTVALGGAFYFARRHVRALEANRADVAELAAMHERIAHLEVALEHLALPPAPKERTPLLPSRGPHVEG